MPSSARTQNVVFGVLVEIMHVSGVVEVTFWYRKGMPRTARVSGDRTESVEVASDGRPLRPRRVPRRV